MKATVRILNRVGRDRGFGNDEGDRQIRECDLGVMMRSAAVSSEHCKQEVYSVKVVVLPEFFLGTSTLRPLVRAKYPIDPDF